MENKYHFSIPEMNQWYQEYEAYIASFKEKIIQDDKSDVYSCSHLTTFITNWRSDCRKQLMRLRDQVVDWKAIQNIIYDKPVITLDTTMGKFQFAQLTDYLPTVDSTIKEELLNPYLRYPANCGKCHEFCYRLVPEGIKGEYHTGYIFWRSIPYFHSWIRCGLYAIDAAHNMVMPYAMFEALTNPIDILILSDQEVKKLPETEEKMRTLFYRAVLKETEEQSKRYQTK